jgi:hypothetical protein
MTCRRADSWSKGWPAGLRHGSMPGLRHGTYRSLLHVQIYLQCGNGRPKNRLTFLESDGKGIWQVSHRLAFVENDRRGIWLAHFTVRSIYLQDGMNEQWITTSMIKDYWRRQFNKKNPETNSHKTGKRSILTSNELLDVCIDHLSCTTDVSCLKFIIHKNKVFYIQPTYNNYNILECTYLTIWTFEKSFSIWHSGWQLTSSITDYQVITVHI